MDDAYNRLVAARAKVGKLHSPVEAEIFYAVIDPLIVMHRPPTDADVDAALGRIGEAEALAHEIACAALRYVRDMLDEARRQGGSEEDFSYQFKELRALTSKYEEAMMP